jgi:hypothetical protein
MAVYATHPAWNPPAPEWLSLQQAATIYGVSVDTLRRQASRSTLRREAHQGAGRGSRSAVPTHSHRRRARQAAHLLTGGWTHLAALALRPTRARSWLEEAV